MVVVVVVVAVLVLATAVAAKVVEGTWEVGEVAMVMVAVAEEVNAGEEEEGG